MKIRILLYFLLSLRLCYSQGNIFKTWYFGQNGGMNFNGGPTVLTGNAGGGEGVASIADASGNLLFYSDGITIWNKNHVAMSNADGTLTGSNWDSCQGPLIVQRPGSTSVYYVFNSPNFASSGNLRYTIVDMNLNGGLGDVPAPLASNRNVLFPATLPGVTSEKLTAIRHCNGVDWWIVTHDLTAGGSNTYRAWRFSSAGLSNCTTSSAGSTFTTAGQQAIGWMVGNHAGSKIATACYNKQTLDVVDFNNSTGVVSNARVATAIPAAYGVEFSPNDSKVYVTSNASIFQYDATATPAAFNGTKATVTSAGTNKRSMVIAPNGKIYVALEYSNYMGVINSPNNSAATCVWSATGFDLDPVNQCCPANTWALPNNYKFGNPCVVLSVDWLSFDAKLEDEHKVRLDWVTASERNSAIFMIERSADGINFQEIGMVEAAGTTSDVHQYDFFDDHPLVGTSYYRLQEVDVDGTRYQSGIRVIENDCISLYPNPAQDHAWLNFPNSLVEQESVVLIYNAEGKIVERRIKQPFQKNMLLDLGPMNNGVYLIKIQNHHVKLIIAH
jgi:hypothetical protein